MSGVANVKDTRASNTAVVAALGMFKRILFVYLTKWTKMFYEHKLLAVCSPASFTRHTLGLVIVPESKWPRRVTFGFVRAREVKQTDE